MSTENDMKSKLTDYMNTVFADAPDTPANRDLKEELTRNLFDRYDDLLHEGRTPSAAYSAAIAGVGDIGELIGSTSAPEARPAPAKPQPAAQSKPQPREMTDEEKETVRKYRIRSAVMTSLAIALLILCCLPPILFDGTDLQDTLGVGLMFCMIAAGVILLVVNSIAKPTILYAPRDAVSDDTHGAENAEDADAFDGDRKRPRTTGGKVFKALSAALWIITLLAYLGVSFESGMWGITWMIFLMAAAVENIMKAIFEIVQGC